MEKETRNLILFFVITLAVTCGAYFTIVLRGWSPYEAPGIVFFLIGGSAPTSVGLLFVLFTYDKARRREYFRRLSPRLISGRWWAIIFLIFPLVYAFVYAVILLMGGPLPGMTLLREYIARPWVLPLTLFFGLVSAPFPEEFGWRGYALDPLMERLGRIPGTLVLGFIWGVWHLGLFFMPQTWHGQMGFRFAGFATFILFSIGLALVMTWVHLNTHGSILAAMLIHLMSNFTSSALLPQPDQAEIVRMLVLIALGLFLCLQYDRVARSRAAASLSI